MILSLVDDEMLVIRRTCFKVYYLVIMLFLGLLFWHQVEKASQILNEIHITSRIRRD